MNTLKTLSATAAFALAAFLPVASQAQGVEVLNEGFNDVSNMRGWQRINDGLPSGIGWFQGNPGVFSAYSGTANSYIAANFQGAADGWGSVDNWLITPTLALSGTSTLSFFTRTADEPGFSDMLEVRFSSGSGWGVDVFQTVLATVGPDGYPANWQQFSTSLDFTGTGRFAFRYVGNADALNYIGLDGVKVVTAVPEPSTYLMLGLGLGLIGMLRRKSVTRF